MSRKFVQHLVRFGLAILGVCLVASGAGRTEATVLFYDGFDTSPGQYTSGASIGGQSGGTGSFFVNPWIQPAGDDLLVLPTSLSVPNQLQPSIGGSLGDNDVTGCCITGRESRLLTQPWSGRNAPEGTFYMGFLVNYGTSVNGNDPHHRVLEMWAGDAADDANRVLQLGYSAFTGTEGPNHTMAIKVKDSATSTEVLSVLSENLQFGNDGQTHCMVLRFDLSNTASSDSVKVYLDPIGTSEPALASASISGIDLLIDRMGGVTEFSFTGEEKSAVMDEMRVATTFAEVALCGVPEPGAMVLAAVCGVAGLGLKRQRLFK